MSCFGGNDDQIYLIEMLIERLALTPSKMKDVGTQPIVVKIKLLDFPLFEFTRQHSALRSNQDLRFMIGKCYMFNKRPRDLVAELRSSRMKVGVFRAKDTYPTAETELSLPGCMCDQISMIGNDPANQPKPFAVKGGFHLVDPGDNPSGTLYMEFILVYLGRGFFTNYELHPKPIPGGGGEGGAGGGPGGAAGGGPGGAAGGTQGAAGDKTVDRELYLKRFVPAELLDLPPKVEPPPVPVKKPKKPKKKKKKKKKGKK